MIPDSIVLALFIISIVGLPVSYGRTRTTP